MTKRKRIVLEVAQQLKERKITGAILPSQLDEFSRHKSHKLRRLFGSFRRAMKIILNELKNVDDPIPAPKPAKKQADKPTNKPAEKPVAPEEKPRGTKKEPTDD